MRYWLFKSEPGAYGIDDLKRDRRSEWDGVRNYQARNLLRDEVQKGDLVLFYHSNAKPPHVAGLARVVRGGYPDPSQFDRRSPTFDPKTTPEAPRWFAVDVTFIEKLPGLRGRRLRLRRGLWGLPRGLRRMPSRLRRRDLRLRRGVRGLPGGLRRLSGQLRRRGL